MMNKSEAISIITPTYNMARMLPNALNSMLGQDYPHIEHIILDGNSTDSTLTILLDYQKAFSNSTRECMVFSEDDSGMYDAINKGIERSSGSILGFLNADDWYPPNLFLKIITFFNSNPEKYAYGGSASVYSFDSEGRKHFVRRLPLLKDDKLFDFILHKPFSFNGWFFRREVFEFIGPMDQSLKISGDKDFMFRFALSSLPFVYTDQIHYNYSEHAESKTFSDHIGSLDYWKEDLKILRALVTAKDKKENKIVLIPVRKQYCETCWKIIVSSLRAGRFPIRVLVCSILREPVQMPRLILKKVLTSFGRNSGA